jgi:hypothetical protein
MPKFFLQVTKGVSALPNDPDPEEFADLEAARVAALEAMREMASEALYGNRLLDIDSIDIADEHGNFILKVPRPPLAN